MSRLTWGRAALGAVVAAGLGLAAGTLPGHHGGEPQPSYEAAGILAAQRATPGDRMRAAIDGVQRTGLYIGPELRDELTPTEVGAVERIIASAPVPVFIVWWAETRDGGYRNAYAALDQLRAGVGVDGLYAVATEGSYPLYGALGYDTPYVEADGKGRPGPALTRIATGLAEVTPRRRSDTSIESGTLGQTEASDFDYWGGPGGGFGAGLLIVASGYLGLLAVIGLLGVLVRGLAGRARGGRG